jgi:26S proteasome non-ATPase regulatory subunit 5
LLLRHQSICTRWLEFGSSTKLPVKTNCLHSIARILEEPTVVRRSANDVPAENAGIWSLLERLFAGFGAESRKPSTMTLLMELLRLPFEELRMAVFAVLRAVAAQNSEWGMRALLSYGGFFEFLLDRSTEPTKETREWKFAILDAVLASPFRSRLGTWA